MSRNPTEQEIEALERDNRKLGLLVQRAELRARLCRAIEGLDWISREEAAAYLDYSKATQDRYLEENKPWIRMRKNGSGKNGRKSIYRRDVQKLHLRTATGGDEIPEEKR
ncbi:MAG: hypothetical protein AAGK14_08965 [Verrucomicrobiota bacterium]